MREQFDAEEETQEEPFLSMDEMTRGLDRSQAAKFFYQVCGKHRTLSYKYWATAARTSDQETRQRSSSLDILLLSPDARQ